MGNVFFKGCEAAITHEDEKGYLCIKIVKNLYPNDMKVKGDRTPYTLGNVIHLHKSNVEPLCNDVYAIGDKVRTTFRGGLVGYVVGFEPWTNLVIACSEKLSNYTDKRVRYAYSLDELNKFKPLLRIIPGHFYAIKDMVCMAVEDFENTIMFVSKLGKIVNSRVPKELDAELYDTREVGPW